MAQRAQPATSPLRRRDLTAESFHRLLAWLGPDPDTAGNCYEQIRAQLIKIFECRGCTVPEELADETFNRVAAKLHDVEASYVGNPALYFYGVANKIFLEYTRRPVEWPAPVPATQEENDIRREYLEQCIGTLSPEQRQIVLAYYGDELRNKIERRKALAELNKLGMNALCSRVHRIRAALRRCVEQHLGRTRHEVNGRLRQEAND